MFWMTHLSYILVAIHYVALARSEQIGITPPSVESVQAVLDDATQLVQRSRDGHSQHLSHSVFHDLRRDVEELAKEMEFLEVLTNQVTESQSNVNRLVRMANSQRLEALLLRLNDTLERETQIRILELQQLQQPRRRSRAGIEEETGDVVTYDVLDERISVEAIMDETESEMKKWILEVIQEELAVYKEEVIPGIEVGAISGGADRSGFEAGDNVEGCPTTVDVVQKVQQALNDYANDGIGRMDHAQGAKVVHWWTSETYSPPAKPSEKLGSAWWRRFIPEDWERLFPEGWEDWSVAIPSYLYHSLGFLNGALAPPETILQKNILPGACWPMAGTNGQVTIKLSYPVVVDAVSIDHVSSDIVPDGHQTTAPKHIKIVGYPPCDSDDVDCLALGFDMGDPIDVAEIMYDVESGTSVQTFESNYAKAIRSLPTPELGDDQGDGPVTDESKIDTPGSCSVTGATSCSAPPRRSVAGVTINVLGNWGHHDFTCLYRVRIHGEGDNM